jgi:hypothetical protein
MNRRLAKKVLKAPSRYDGHQKNGAAHRLFRAASRAGDGVLAFRALRLKPRDSFATEDQVDLKFQKLLGQHERGEQLTVSTKDVLPPPPVSKPAFRRDGQVHNFAAIPFPGQERRQPTLTQYQVRDQNHRARPKRSVADFANLTDKK